MSEHHRLQALLDADTATEPLPLVWVVTQARWTATLTPEEKERARFICPPRTFARGECVFRQGDPAEHVHIVLQGHVKLQVAERVVHFCGPGDLFGESFLTDAPHYEADAIIIGDEAVICLISQEKFLEIAEQVPKAILAFTSVLAKHNADLQLRLRDMTRSAHVRVVRTLIDLTRRFGVLGSDGRYALQIDVNQSDIASLSNTSRATATEVISDLRQRDLVIGTRGKYWVDLTNLETLVQESRAAEGGPTT